MKIDYATDEIVFSDGYRVTKEEYLQWEVLRLKNYSWQAIAQIIRDSKELEE